MAADAMLLSADLLLSQPAASGTTALDRLARSRANAPPAEAAAIAALRKAQFRLLRLERDAPVREVMVRDFVSASGNGMLPTKWMIGLCAVVALITTPPHGRAPL